MPRATTVDGDGVPLACVDHGGRGPDLVLLHGAGSDQAALIPLAGLLTEAFRVVTYDTRGHGRTPAAPWTFDTAVADLQAVVGDLHLDRPAVAGHSLGGMVAAEHARRTPGCPAAINLDGHGLGRPEQYVGVRPDAAAAWTARKRATSRAVVASRTARAVGRVGRALGGRPPSPEVLLQVLDAVDALDLRAVYAQVRGPLQVVSATAAPTGLAAALTRGSAAMTAAYREGVRRDLKALARPGLVHTEIEAPHMLVRTHPAQTARAMRAFLHGVGLTAA